MHQHFLTLYADEKGARKDIRIRLGMIVKKHPTVFTATLTDGIDMVGLAASPVDDWKTWKQMTLMQPVRRRTLLLLAFLGIRSQRTAKTMGHTR
jgi:hypothetical protein